MRKLYLSLLLIFCAFVQLQAQNVNVTATAGTANGSYLTLKAAFDAINAGTHQGAITVTIITSTVETATAQLNANAVPASYSGITISTSSLVSVSASIASSLISFNGATNVSINGGNSLTLSNPNTTGSVISFTNDASNNKIRKCNIQGNTTSTTSGVINFGAGTSTGSDGNLLDSCNITGNGAAARLIYSAGNTATSANQNSADTIRGCLLHDITGATAAPTYIYLSAGNTNWVIQDNSIYQTLPLTVTTQGITRGILAVPAWTSDAHTIIGNYIGGNSANATGTLTINGSGPIAVGFFGLHIETGGPGNLIQRNLIQNVSVSYSFTGGSFSNAGIFSFIGGFNGESSIDRNKILNLSYSNSTGSALAYGILCNGQVIGNASTVEPSFYVTNDTVSNFTGNAGGTGNVQFFGIRFETSSSATSTANTAISNPLFYAYGNLITDMSTTYAGPNTIMRGISNTNTLGAANPQLLPWFVIDSNEIRNITNPGTPASLTSPAVVGIYFTGSVNATTTGNRQFFSRNHIHNLNATATADVNNTATGIYLSNSRSNVYQNRIYDLKNKANGAANYPSIIGINYRAALDSSYIFNNFVSLGTGETSSVNVFGLLNNFTSTGPILAYFNSIYLTGGSGGNTKSSAAILRGTETFADTISTPFNVRNNILYNVRVGTGNQYAIANSFSTPSTGWVSDYNNLYTATPATVARWAATNNDLATYKTNAGDANSRSVTVTFTDVANGNLHLTGGSVGNPNLKGTTIAVISEDYDDQIRGNTPYIGADEVITAFLPVEMEFFTGRRQNAFNLLSWKASCTSSSITFEVERSTDGRRFSSVGKITASQARCSQPFDYTDASPATGMNYYRLRMTEADGALKYSAIIAILNKTKGFELVGLYPNLVKSGATLSITAAEKTSLQIVATDITGRIMLQRSMAVAEGSSLINLDLAVLPSGVYHLTGTTPDGYKKTIRFVKQ